MTPGLDRFRRIGGLPLLLCASLILFSGTSCHLFCRNRPSVDPTRESSARDASESGQDTIQRRDALLQERDRTIRELEEERSRQSLALLEKDARIKQLEEELLSQQRQIDDAVLEVVRVKAKQRSLGTRAEAASELAEAEIAIETLRESAGEARPAELSKAEQLVAMAETEFAEENFGGALYLIGQAKHQIHLGSLKIDSSDRRAEVDGETPFASPLPLTVSKRSNLREGPGVDFKVLAILAAGTKVIGFSARGSWVRVETSSGVSGWIHLTLVRAS